MTEQNQNRSETDSLDQFVDQHMGPHIEALINSSGQEELRPYLRAFFAKYFTVGESIRNVKNPDELEVEIYLAADLLAERIKAATEIVLAEGRAKKREIEKYRLEINDARNELLKGPLGEATGKDLMSDPRFSNIVQHQKEMQRISEENLRTGRDLMDGLSKFQDVAMYLSRENLERPYKRFKRWRRVRKIKQALYRILLAVVIFGVGYGMVTGGAGKFFLTIAWWLYVAFAVLAVVAKEYVISPWIKRKRLDQQRKHLLKSFTDFMFADLNFELLTYERDKAKQNGTISQKT